MKRSDLISVVAAVIERDGSYLLCQRPLEKRHGGLWEFPGGKVRDGESVQKALTRELLEELGVVTQKMGKVTAESKDPGSNFIVMFCPVEVTGKPRAKEHLDVRWVPSRELLNFALAPSDRWFVETFVNNPGD